MAEAIDDRIASCFSHFQERWEEIRPVSQRDFRNILNLSLLEGLPRGRYNNFVSPTKRFTSLIHEYSRWRDAQTVSRAQLLLRLHKPSRFSPGVAFELETQLGRWMSAYKPQPGLKTLGDPPISFFKTEGMPRSVNDLLESTTHARLLYRLRSRYVHEVRTNGYAVEFKGDDQPFYSSVLNLNTEDETP